MSDRAHENGTHPVCRRPLGGIVQPGEVCKVAWFCVFKLTPARDKVHT